jgi:hypothetical protein
VKVANNIPARVAGDSENAQARLTIDPIPLSDYAVIFDGSVHRSEQTYASRERKKRYQAYKPAILLGEATGST